MRLGLIEMQILCEADDELIVQLFNDPFCIYWKTVSKTRCLYFNTHTTLTVFEKSVISGLKFSEWHAEIESTSVC